MDEDECEHLLPIGQCGLCKPPPQGVLKHGWRTKGGRAYHNDPDCDWLRKGHSRSRRQGKETHDAVRVRWADIDPAEVQPCEFCCTPLWLRRHGKIPDSPSTAVEASPAGKPCQVREGGEWWPGTLTWEPTRRTDGRWWANVRYRRDDREITGVKSEQDLRKHR